MWTFAGLTREEWIKLIVFIIGLILLIELARPILGPFILASILAYVLYPVVSWVVARTHLPRGAVVGVLVLALIAVIGLGGYQVGRSAAREARNLQRDIPTLQERINTELQAATRPYGIEFPAVETLINPNAQYGGDPFDLGGALTQFSGVGRALVEAVLVMFATAYLLLDGERMLAGLGRFLPRAFHGPLRPVLNDIQSSLRSYVSAQGMLVILMSVMAYIFVVIPFHLRYGILIAIFVGLLEVVPIAGPWIGIGTAGLLALVQHGTPSAIGVIVVLTVLRQLEDQLVIPFVVGKAVHLPPVITLLAVAVGGLRGGLLGLLLAIPVAAIIKVILDHIYPPDSTSEPAPVEHKAANFQLPRLAWWRRQ